MFPELLSAGQFFLVAFSSIFFLVDPFGVVPTFLAITGELPADRRKAVARKAAITCFVLLTTFALVGGLIFRLFGITLEAFRIAGGLILLLIGIDMVQARRSETNEAPGERAEGASKREDAGIIPLGMPMLAGPGTISAVMVLLGSQPPWWKYFAVTMALFLTALITYLVLAAAEKVRRHLGETGLHILTRLMGMLLVALAVQFIVDGLRAFGFAR